MLLAVQVPFIYRRYRIGQLSDRITAINGERVDRYSDGYTEYKGVMHVHTFLGGHSTGTFEELIAAANANELDFVVMTEHYDEAYDTSALTLNGVYGKTLFINGQEVDANDGGRFLLLPGTSESPSFAKMDSREFLAKVHSEGRLAINNYPDRNLSGVTDFDGVEVYSLHINAKAANLLTAVPDLLWSFPAYPETTIASFLRRNDDYLSRYDAISGGKRLLLTAGADAHSNKGYYLIADDEGNRHFGIKIDPYETIFRIVRMHVLLESGTAVTRESVIEALKKGHAFAGFDVLGDTSGFSFWAEGLGVQEQPPANAGGTDSTPSEKRIMGDEIALADGVRFHAAAPLPARFVLLRNGSIVQEFPGSYEFTINIDKAGTYRVEAYLDQLEAPFDRAPWIMSNPIYVR